ncbi:anti-repressor SinI family protein [Bacillus sp. IITD106]|nr:anti-repressor SinI family protein [Bacillus sp. IITD106]
MKSKERNHDRFAMADEKIYQNLSQDWIELIKDAMGSNVTKDEFRAFLDKNQHERLLRRGH